MKNKLFLLILILFLTLGISVSVSAEEEVNVYNNNEEIALNYEPILCDDEYYIHLDDLTLLGLDVTDVNSVCTISLNDCLGCVKEIIIYQRDTGTGDIFLLSAETNSTETKKLLCDVSLGFRVTQKIGYSQDLNVFIPSLDFPFKEWGMPSRFAISLGTMNALLKTNSGTYISAKLIGENLFKGYSEENGRIDFYIDNNNNVITKTTINLVKGVVAQSGGHSVNVYTAYKTGEENTLDDFEILSSVSCVIPENESKISLEIETPAEKITDKNIYFIADLGERYELAYKEYDFSIVGEVLVYGQQKDVTYTLNVNLPEPDDQDVPFTVSVYAENEKFSKQGVIKSGETSATVEVSGIALSETYKPQIEFDYHKYRNARLEEFTFSKAAYAADFEADYTAKYSNEVYATVSLPEGYVCDGDVEVKVILQEYSIGSGMSIVDEMDWSDSKIITLNNENRSQEVKLYTQESTAMLFCKLNGVYEGLFPKAYFGTSNKATSDIGWSKKITESITASMTLLQKKNVSVSVWRPYSLSTDNEVFARVQIYDFSDKSLAKEFNYTQTPLIPKGERDSKFEFEIAEDKAYYLKIVDISGDNNLFDYFYYGYFSSLDTSSLRIISFTTNNASLDLLKCNNVIGTVLSEDNSTDLTATAICELYNEKIIEYEAEVVDGKFNLKIPEDTDRYTISVQSKVGTKSYYVSDGVSTNIDADATKLPYDYEYKGDKEVTIRYIVQKLSIPFEITWSNYYDCFEYKNNNDYLVQDFDVYLAYYGGDGRLISLEKNTQTKLASAEKSKQYINGNNNHRIKEIKCFIWKKDEMTPLSNICSKEVNMPHIPDNDLSVFTLGEKSAIINCKEETLSKAPRLMNGDLYISFADFEKMGYEIEEEREWVYIKGEWDSYEIPVEENRAYFPDDNDFYEISAPIIYDDNYDLLFPVIAISELFEERVEWHTEGKILVVNRPFPDIDYTDVYIEAIYSRSRRRKQFGPTLRSTG